jgi:peptidoglycan hydrolase-like protein with peptidoglycan-binding domain
MSKPRSSLQAALRHSARAVAAAAAFGLAATAANANADGKKLALVIGNDNYVKAEHLDNPVYDAHAIADKLTKLGFKVVEGYDVTEAQLRETIGNFVDSLAQADVAVVYYAGHGVTYDNENYLLPTDIELKRVADLDLHALTVTSVLKQMSGYDRINLVILDACRENPFPRELAKTTRAMPARGLAPIDTDRARGTLIVYSTDPMAAAADGAKGEHSPFAQALLDHIEDPDVSLSDMLDSVRAEVDATTHHAQMPWESSSLIGKFKFNPILASAAPAPSAGSPAQPSVQTAAIVPAPGPTSGAAGAAPSDGQPVVQPKASSPAAADGSAGPPATSKPDQTASLEGPPSSGVSAAPEMEPGDPLGEKNLKLAPADVKRLQLHLEIRRLYHGALDGDIDGASTRSAILEWQKTERLPPTSFLSQGQLSALLAISPIKPNSADLLKEMGTKVTQDALRLTQDEIREIQLRLAAAGYLKGAPSGKLDSTTSEAISRFQHDEGCVPSGSLGPLQLQELFAVTETRYEGSLDSASPGAAQATTPERSPGVYHPKPQPQRHMRNYSAGSGGANGFNQMLNSFSAGFGNALGNRIFH